MSQIKHKSKFTPETRLVDTGLIFIDVVLTERFLLPPDALRKIGEKVPETLAEISELNGMPISEIVSVIEECLAIGTQIWRELESLDTIETDEKTQLVDMRPLVSMESEPLHIKARMFHLQDPGTILPFLRTVDIVYVLSDKEDHAWSAAMALRKMGIKAYLPKIIGSQNRTLN